jgi:hypothetical protein
MPRSVKTYYCPLCGNKEDHSTNHTGEIYTGCRKCGHSVLYCEQTELAEPFIEVKLHAYRFDFECSRIHHGISYETWSKKRKPLCDRCKHAYDAYLELRRFLETQSRFKCFNVLAKHSEVEALKAHDGEIIQLYKASQFEDQYVSNIGRVHNWFEAVFPNDKVKAGYYLEFSTRNLLMSKVPDLKPEHFDSHESDLYVKFLPGVRDAILKYLPKTTAENVTSFISEIDGSQWLDMPFMNSEFWERKQGARR